MRRVNELKELTRVRVLSFMREPEAIFWVFVFPIVLSAVLGFAFRTGKIEPVRVGVLNASGAEALVEAFDADELIETDRFDDEDRARVQLRKAAIDVLVTPGAEPEADPRLTFDPARSESETAKLRVQRAIRIAAGEQETPLELDPVSEAGSRYIDFLFPGLLGMNIMGTGMWGLGFSIADFRRSGFLKRLLCTPMRRSSFLASFMLSRVVTLGMELSVLPMFGVWVLGVPFRADILSFVLIAGLGALTFAGLGLLIASRAKTMQGVSGLMNVVMMPMWLASGVFFSYERFPDAVHPVLRLLPLTALNDALRAVMIDGESILTQGSEVAIMAAWTVGSFALALKIFRWE